MRDQIVDFIGAWAAKTELSVDQWVQWVGMAHGKFYAWKQRYGKANEHNGKIPRDHWLEAWEGEKILEFHCRYPLEG